MGAFDAGLDHQSNPLLFQNGGQLALPLHEGGDLLVAGKGIGLFYEIAWIEPHQSFIRLGGHSNCPMPTN